MLAIETTGLKVVGTPYQYCKHARQVRSALTRLCTGMKCHFKVKYQRKISETQSLFE